MDGNNSYLFNLNRSKMKNNLFLLVISLGIIICSCDEEPIGQIPTDSLPPAPVSNVQVENIAGGALLTYTLPDNEDLLYVKAVYSLKDGVTSEVKASLYTDTLKIEGFGDMQARQVSVYAVDRSKNESESVQIAIEPLEPPVLTIGETLRLVEDFGGVHAYWENSDRAEVSIVITKTDHNEEYTPLEVFYTSLAVGEGAARGLDTLESYFATYVEDRWGNKSEIKYDTLVPLFEQQFDPANFKEVKLPNDVESAYGWVLSNIWDGTVGDQGFHTASGGNWPQSFTIDLGVTGKVSRIKEYQRQNDWIYRHGNLKKFEVWGAATLDPSGSWDSWVKLMDCESVKPSGLPLGQYSSEDQTWAVSGEEFINSPENPPVRYIRILVTEDWSGGDFLHLSELEVFGDYR